MTLSEALTIIDQAVDTTQYGPTDEIIESLRFLSGKVERKCLIWYWESLHSENDIGRSQNLNAARNRIRWLLRMPAV